MVKVGAAVTIATTTKCHSIDTTYNRQYMFIVRSKADTDVSIIYDTEPETEQIIIH